MKGLPPESELNQEDYKLAGRLLYRVVVDTGSEIVFTEQESNLLKKVLSIRMDVERSINTFDNSYTFAFAEKASEIAGEIRPKLLEKLGAGQRNFDTNDKGVNFLLGYLPLVQHHFKITSRGTH